MITETRGERPSINSQITHAEDGEPHYQDVKLKHFLPEKGYIVNHAEKIVKYIVECFNKCYGNAISETSKAAVNVHGDKGDHLLLDVS